MWHVSFCCEVRFRRSPKRWNEFVNRYKSLGTATAGIPIPKAPCYGSHMSRDVCISLSSDICAYMAINLYLLISILYIWITTVARSNLKPRRVVIACIMIPKNLVFGRERTTAEIFGSSTIFLWCLAKEKVVRIFYFTVNSDEHMRSYGTSNLVVGRSTKRNTITIIYYITRYRYGLGITGGKQAFIIFSHISKVGETNSHWGSAASAVWFSLNIPMRKSRLFVYLLLMINRPESSRWRASRFCIPTESWPTCSMRWGSKSPLRMLQNTGNIPVRWVSRGPSTAQRAPNTYL